MSETNTPLIGGNIANIERAKVVTIETSPKTYIFDTATSATYTAAVSSGEEKEQRCGNTLMGLLQTEDITKGYDLKLEDPRLIPEILALIDGGTLATTGESDAKKTTYSAPAAGKPVTRKKFDFYLYTSDRDTDADVIKYNEWKFPKCKGAPISGSMTQGDFSKMEYNLKSRPAMGESPLTIAEVDALPEPTA